jgi:hypothetical protein
MSTTQIHSTQRQHHSGAKTSQSTFLVEKQLHPPLNLDPVYLIRIDSYFVLFKDVCSMKYSYLETRSHHVNTSFIILGLPIFGVDCDQAWSLEGSSLTHKHLAWLEMPDRCKHFRLFGPFIEYDFKKF